MSEKTVGATHLTPVPGGHVFNGTWEQFQALFNARCEACGDYIKVNGRALNIHTVDDVVAGRDEPVCAGWKDGPPRPALDNVVRAIVREAPGDQPNGPIEEAIAALHESHLALLHEVTVWGHTIGMSDEVRTASKTTGDRIFTLTNAIADQVRALRLAQGERP